MANQKYAQVVDLLAAGRLNWATDDIVGALLAASATFDVSDTLVSQVGTVVAVAPLPDRYVQTGGECYGSPLIYELVQGGADYKMVIAQNVGAEDFNVLAWYDQNSLGQPLHVESDGTLIVRPSVAIPDTTVRLWMKY
jgi:hypothetical protein